MSKLENVIDVLDDKVVFQFLDEIDGESFKTIRKSGIIVAETQDNQVGEARWAKVLMIGPDVSEVEKDDFILIEPLRWTTGLKVSGFDSKFWMTDEKSVMAVSDEAPQ